MQVLYKDSDILVIVKPAGILSERAEDKAGKSVADSFPHMQLQQPPRKAVPPSSSATTRCCSPFVIR